MTPWIVGVALCVAAYIVGRARPLRRVRDWSAWQAQRADLGEAKALLLLALNPDLIVAAFWKRRSGQSGSTPNRSAPQLGQEWQKRVQAIHQAEDTLAVLDRALPAPEATPDAPKGGED